MADKGKLDIDFEALKSKIITARDAVKEANRALSQLKDNQLGTRTTSRHGEESVWLHEINDDDIWSQVETEFASLEAEIGDGWSTSSLFC